MSIKSRIVIAMLIFLAVSVMYYAIYIGNTDQEKPLFKNPGSLTQSIANAVAAKGTATPYNIGLADEGVDYELKLYKFVSAYHVNVWKEKATGHLSLQISLYETNRNFDELKSAADFAAEEAAMGPIKIYREFNMSDNNMDGKADVIQIFEKRVPSGKGFMLEPFTRKERDSKTSGVTQTMIEAGSSADNDTDTVLWYNVQLAEIARILKIMK